MAAFDRVAAWYPRPKRDRQAGARSRTAARLSASTGARLDFRQSRDLRGQRPTAPRCSCSCRAVPASGHRTTPRAARLRWDRRPSASTVREHGRHRSRFAKGFSYRVNDRTDPQLCAAQPAGGRRGRDRAARRSAASVSGHHDVGLQSPPESCGACHVTSADPDRHPEIRPNCLSTDHDRRVAAISIKAANAHRAIASLEPGDPLVARMDAHERWELPDRSGTVAGRLAVFHGPRKLAEYECDGSPVADAPAAEHGHRARSAAARFTKRTGHWTS